MSRTEQLLRVRLQLFHQHHLDTGLSVLYMQGVIMPKRIREKTHQPLQDRDAVEKRGRAALEFF